MKRTLFVLSLLTLLLTGFSTLQAQNVASASPAKSGMPVAEAYKVNFVAAVNQGNTMMADAHRIKMVRNFEREIGLAEASNTANASSSKQKAADIARQKTIAETFKTMDLSTPAALEAAKTKFALIDEFAKISAKNLPVSGN